MATPHPTLADRVRAEAQRLGFDLVGITDVHPSEHAAFYRRWLERGRHGSMSYLARPDAVARRLDPGAAFPELRSAIVVALGYDPAPLSAAPLPPASDGAVDPSRGIIARYARGRDYHKVMKKKLVELLRWLEGEVGRELPAARAYVDTGPVFERELARRAGLGWFGRSTMLIHPRRGSFFFLGTLLVELDLEPDPPFEADHCGTCSACVDACPTGALLGRDDDGAPVIDATRCIAYLTIENRGPIPRELRPAIGNRVFGCDICQEVCPFTRKFSTPTTEPAFAARGPGEPPHGVEPPGPTRRGAGPEDGTVPARAAHPGTDAPRLVDLMAMDEAGWEAFSRGSAIRRAGYAGFKRNVAVALGNWLGGVGEGAEGGAVHGGVVDGGVVDGGVVDGGAVDGGAVDGGMADGGAVDGGAVEGAAPEVGAAIAALIAALDDEDPLVRGHAAWAVGRVETAGARRALEARLEVEEDPVVREELVAARWGTRAPST